MIYGIVGGVIALIVIVGVVLYGLSELVNDRGRPGE